MSETIQIPKVDNQIWGAKENSIMVKIEPDSPMIQVAKRGDIPVDPMCFSMINLPLNIDNTIKVKRKEKILSLIRKDTSTPKDLHLKVGRVKELADGVFIKKKPDGTLELYVSEE